MLDIPDALLLNSNEVDTAKIASVGWSFDSDVQTSGVLRVFCMAGEGKVNVAGLVGEWQVQGGESLTNATVEGIEASDAVGDVVFCAEFSGGGGTDAVSRALTVVQTGNVELPSAPGDGLVVLTNTPVAMQLNCEPDGAGSLLSTVWQTRRLRGNGSYDDWQLAGLNYGGANHALTPSDGGIYQIRVLASASGGGTDVRYYVWDTDENSTTGRKTKGMPKAVQILAGWNVWL